MRPFLSKYIKQFQARLKNPGRPCVLIFLTCVFLLLWGWCLFCLCFAPSSGYYIGLWPAYFSTDHQREQNLCGTSTPHTQKQELQVRQIRMSHWLLTKSRSSMKVLRTLTETLPYPFKILGLFPPNSDPISNQVRSAVECSSALCQLCLRCEGCLIRLLQIIPVAAMSEFGDSFIYHNAEKYNRTERNRTHSLPFGIQFCFFF